MRDRKSQFGAQPHFARTDRVNEVVRRVIAERLEVVAQDDARLNLVTITSVDVDPDLRNATVYFSSLDTLASTEDVIEALGGVRKSLQSAIATEMRMKRTPHLRFAPDTAIEGGLRVEAILRDIARDQDAE